MLSNKMFVFEAPSDQGGGDQANDQSNDQGNQGDPVEFKSFDDWYASLPDDGKKMADPARDHFTRMQGAIKNARAERDRFAQELRDATSKLDAGSKEKERLEQLASSAEEANRRADFFEDAATYECRNAKAAYAVAVSSGLFSKSGQPDWKAIREAAPELFGKQASRQTAGAGTNNDTIQQGGMSDWIRQKAGRSRTTT